MEMDVGIPTQKADKPPPKSGFSKLNPVDKTVNMGENKDLIKTDLILTDTHHNIEDHSNIEIILVQESTSNEKGSMDIDDLDKVCRICLSREELASLHQNKDYSTFAFLLQTCHKSGIPVNNIYPSNICKACSSELQIVSCFISKLKKTTEQLNTLFDEEVIEIEVNKSKRISQTITKHKNCIIEEEQVEEAIIIEEEIPAESVKNSEGSKLFKCEHCSRTFNYFTSWQCHMEKHQEIDKHKCQYCDFINLDEEKYQMHLKTLHGDELIYDSSYAETYFEGLDDNFESKPKKLASLTIEGTFKCNACGIIFKESGNLHKHLLTHNDHTGVQCEHCGKVLADNFRLQTHLEKYHDKTCGPDEVITRKHKKRKQTKEKPGTYPCVICEKNFVFKSSLKRHIQTIHDQNKRFCCDICGEKFTVKNSLKYHMYIHSDSKPYQCDLCPKAFRQPAALFRHQKTKHKHGKDFLCDICMKMFKTSKGLESHSIKHARGLI